MANLEPKKPRNEAEKPKFSLLLTSSIVTVTVAKSRTFYLHSDLLIAESDRFCKELTGDFKEADKKSIDLEDEDPELFGFFVEYLYCDRSILSREIQHSYEYVILARLYAMGERLLAPKFKAYSLWRFGQSIHFFTAIPDVSTCALLRTASMEITETAKEDPMRAHIFWYAAARITELQKTDTFRQLLCDIPHLGRHLCLWISQMQPLKPEMPKVLRYQKFVPESESAPEGFFAAAP